MRVHMAALGFTVQSGKTVTGAPGLETSPAMTTLLVLMAISVGEATRLT